MDGLNLETETFDRIRAFVTEYYTEMDAGYNNRLGGANQIKQAFETYNQKNNIYEYVENEKFARCLERLGYRCNDRGNFNLNQNRRWSKWKRLNN
jgi:hypothetical protein